MHAKFTGGRSGLYDSLMHPGYSDLGINTFTYKIEVELIKTLIIIAINETFLDKKLRYLGPPF